MHRRFRIDLPKIHRRFRIGLLKLTDGSVLALLRLPSIFSCQNSTVGEFWGTMAIMNKKQQNFLFEIECSVLALLRLPSIFSCQNSTAGEFWCTMAIMQEKQQNFLFEKECFICHPLARRDQPVPSFLDFRATIKLFMTLTIWFCWPTRQKKCKKYSFNFLGKFRNLELRRP